MNLFYLLTMTALLAAVGFETNRHDAKCVILNEEGELVAEYPCQKPKAYILHQHQAWAALTLPQLSAQVADLSDATEVGLAMRTADDGYMSGCARRSELIEIPNLDSGKMLLEALLKIDTDSGGVAEGGGLVAANGAILMARPGLKALADSHQATIDPWKIEDRQRLKEHRHFVAVFHSHPSGSLSGRRFHQQPSPQDILNLANWKAEGALPTHALGYVFALKVRRLYVYDEGGIILSVPLSIYLPDREKVSLRE